MKHSILRDVHHVRTCQRRLRECHSAVSDAERNDDFLGSRYEVLLIRQRHAERDLQQAISQLRSRPILGRLACWWITR